MLQKLKNLVLDFFYPSFCLVCRKPDTWLCFACRDGMVDVVVSERQISNKSYRIISFGPYLHPGWQALLKHLKYHRATCIQPTLVELTPAFEELVDLNKHPLVTFVPSDPTRVRERDLEHGSLLAKIVSDRLGGLTLSPLLLRTRPTHLNSHLENDDERLANMHDVFVCTSIIGDPIILVDDVLTSGATADEAVKALFKAGAEDVTMVVFASRRG